MNLVLNEQLLDVTLLIIINFIQDGVDIHLLKRYPISDLFYFVLLILGERLEAISFSIW